jgi:hypothetical protein
MTLMNCEAFRQSLEPYIDGELSGAEMLRVSDHLAICRRCAAEADALSHLGNLVRDSAAQYPAPHLPEGLASGLIARVGAEAAQSWRALLARAVDGWHWAAVGAGSVAATFVVALLVGTTLWFAQTPQRADSLAALMANLQGSAGTFFIEGRRSGIDTQPVMMSVDSGAFGASAREPRIVPASLRLGDETEADLLLQLLGVMDRGGRRMDLSPADRRYAEELLDRIGELRSRAVAQGTSGHVMVYRLHLVASTNVSAKALNP